MDKVLLGEKYCIELGDEGSLDTIIKVNGKNIRFPSGSGVVRRNNKGEITNWGYVVKLAVETYQNLYE